MKTIWYLFVLTLFFWVDAGKAALDSDPNRHIFAMPVSETEQVAVSWFQNNDFELLRETIAPLSVHFEVTKQNLQWSVLLIPHSPLATIVTVKPIQGDQDALLKDFWRHLDGYIKIPNTSLHGGHSTIPSIVRSRLDAVVCIYSQGRSGSIQLTGFAINTKGGIITTAHDLVVGTGVSVRLRSGREISGQVVKLDPYLDLCLIQIPEALEASLPLNNGCFTPRRGQQLFALRCSGPGIDEIRQGVLEGPPRRVQGLPLWQVHMQVEPGSSGGPILDARGRLAGVVKGRYRGTNAIGFLIPFETLLHFLETN